MLKKPKTFNCHCPTVNHVTFVMEFTPGTAPNTFISHAMAKAMLPKAMNFPGAGLSVLEQPRPQVLQIFIITESTVTAVRIVATALMLGSQAGTGAECGMPLQLANRMMVQKVKSARFRL